MSESIADRTWRNGFLHLTVDGDGMVSLWDDEHPEPCFQCSYLRLPLTKKQQKLIARTMAKGGATP